MQQPPNPYPQYQQLPQQQPNYPQPQTYYPSQQEWQQPSQPLSPEQQWQQQPLPSQQQWQLPSQPFTPQWQSQPQIPLYQQLLTPAPQMYPSPLQPYPQQMTMYPPMPAPQINNVVVVSVNKSSPNFLLRVLWYIFIGCWLGFFWLNIGYFFCFTIIGLPLGLVMLNRLPWVLTLRPASQNVNVSVSTTTNMTASTTTTMVNIGAAQQYSMLVRALYFMFVGSWAGYIWACMGYVLCMFIVTIPLGLVMLNRLPAVITLRRN